MNAARRWDLLCAAVVLALGLLLALTVPAVRVVWWPVAPETLPWVDGLALVIAAAGLTQRRSCPLAGLALVTAALAAGPLLLGVTGIGVLLAFGDLLYCAVRHTPRRTSWAVAGSAGTVLALAGATSLVSQGPGTAVLTVLNLSLLLGVPVVWAREVRHHSELAETERGRAEQARQLAELDRAAAVAAERARMARDLHDVIAGQLCAIAIQSEAALTLPDPDPTTLHRVLTAVRRDSVASLAEMRAMIGLLRADGSADAEPRTAPAGLDQLDTLLDTGRANGLRIDVDDRRPPDRGVPAAVDLAAFRIVQEALTNAAKHASGSTVRMTLLRADGELVIELENDLVPGGPPAGGTDTGLLGLEERATAVGGSVEAGARERTWAVRAVLPAPVLAPEGATR